MSDPYLRSRSGRHDSYYPGLSVRSNGSRIRRHSSRESKRRMFTPGRRNTSYDSRRERSATATPAMVLKHGGLSLAEKEIKGLLDDLHPYSGTQISDLSSDISKKFNRLVSYVGLLYNTPEYETFYQWVINKYGNQNEVIPATVGGYLAGCTLPTSFSKTAPGCAVSCAASMPRPRSDHTFRHCDNTVLMGRFNGESYRFTLLRRALNQQDHEKAYLYINTGSNGNYHGFTEAEKKNLLATGVKQVKLYGYQDGMNYTELTSGLVAIEDLKSRSEMSASDGAGSRDGRHGTRRKDLDPPTSGSNAAWIVIIIVVILVVIFLIWLAWGGNRKTEYTTDKSDMINQTV